jgi:iron complex outermembrane receptor protein
MNYWSKFTMHGLIGALLITPILAKADEGVLQEIVVTAQKREENLQSVPIAVTAVTAEELQTHNGYDLQQITNLIPGLQFSLEGEDVNILMRGNPGVGTPTGSSGTVTLYQDGILRQVTSEFQAGFTDTSRVEVARGPQGTLSGRNAFAGSVNVVSNPPVFGAAQFGVDETLTNYSGTRDEFFVNLPAGDLFAVRLSAYRERRDGVIRNLLIPQDSLQDRNNDYGRLQIAFKPSEDISAVLRLADWRGGGNGSGDFGVSVRGVPINPLTGHTTAGVTSPGIVVNRLGVSCTDPSFNPNTASEIGAPGSSPPLEGGIPAAGPCNTPADPGPYETSRNGPAIRDVHQKEINGEFNWDIAESVRFRALLSYVNYTEFREYDGDYGPSGGTLLSPTNPDNLNPGGPQLGLVSINEDYERTRTEELQLLSSGHSKLQWVFGTFFEQNRSWNAFDFAFADPTPGSQPIAYTPYAFNLNPQTLRCCGGPANDFIWYFPVDTVLRSESAYGDLTYSITDTWRAIGGARYTRDHVVGTSYFFTLDGSNNPARDDEVFPHTTWRAGLEHDLNHNQLLYATASTGFIAGGANPGGAAPYQPQTDKSYEIGSKNLLFNGTLRVNADIYYVEYDNLLVSSFNPANSLTTSKNAGNSHAHGLELESQWQPTQDVHFRLVGSYLVSKYGNTILGPSALFYDGQNLPASYGKGAEGFLVDGLSTRNAPKVQMNSSLDYDLHLGDYGVLTPGIDETYVDKYRTFYQPYFFAYQNSYWQTNLRLVWHSPKYQLSVEGFVTNLENEAIRIFTTPNQGGIIYDQYQDPRIFGVRFNYRTQ